jgi:hypothetical protein
VLGLILAHSGCVSRGARAGVGLEGGLRLQLVPPFPWPHLSSYGLEVDLTDGAHFNLELKFSINSNDFTRMVSNNLYYVMKEKYSPARTSLCLPCKSPFPWSGGHRWGLPHVSMGLGFGWSPPTYPPACPGCCSRNQGGQRVLQVGGEAWQAIKGLHVILISA